MRQFTEGMVGQEILTDVTGRGTGQLTADFHGTVAWGEFGAAAFAGAKTRHLRRGRMTEEPAVFL